MTSDRDIKSWMENELEKTELQEQHDEEFFKKPTSRKTASEHTAKAFKGTVYCPRCNSLAFQRHKSMWICNKCGFSKKLDD